MPGLEITGGAKLFVLVLPVSPNPTFLIICPSWDLLMPHLPVLNEASCCLSSSNRDNKRTISHMYSELTSLLHCSCCWGLGTGPQGWRVHLMGLCEPEGLMMRKYYWEAIWLNHQWLPELLSSVSFPGSCGFGGLSAPTESTLFSPLTCSHFWMR